jgi:hypothetical protein
MKAVEHLYAGQLADGRQVEYTNGTYLIKDIKFNVELPDDLFKLDLPSDAKIYDGVAGHGWLPAGSDAAFWTDPPVQRKGTGWYVVGGIIGLLLVVGVGAYMMYRRRRIAKP